MQLSRRAEFCLLIFFFLLSLVGLGLTIRYGVMEDLPHEERIDLKLYPGALIIHTNAGRQLVHDHPISAENEKLEAPAWLSVSFLLNDSSSINPRGGGGATSQFTSFVDLPYGVDPPLNWTQALRGAAAFQRQLQRQHYHATVWIDRYDPNTLFFNQSTGSAYVDQKRSWDPVANEMVAFRTVGEGVDVADGFLLALTGGGVLLTSLGFALRIYADYFDRSRTLLGQGGEASLMGDHAGQEEEEDGGMRTGTGTGRSGRRVRFHQPFARLKDEEEEEQNDEDEPIDEEKQMERRVSEDEEDDDEEYEDEEYEDGADVDHSNAAVETDAVRLEMKEAEDHNHNDISDQDARASINTAAASSSSSSVNSSQRQSLLHDSAIELTEQASSSDVR